MLDQLKIALAEEAGFEPARALQLLSVFETDPFNHLGIPPMLLKYTKKARLVSLRKMIKKSCKLFHKYFHEN
jgi:hypothetical protein